VKGTIVAPSTCSNGGAFLIAPPWRNGTVELPGRPQAVNATAWHLWFVARRPCQEADDAGSWRPWEEAAAVLGGEAPNSRIERVDPWIEEEQEAEPVLLESTHVIPSLGQVISFGSQWSDLLRKLRPEIVAHFSSQAMSTHTFCDPDNPMAEDLGRYSQDNVPGKIASCLAGVTPRNARSP
jgi:hypothetical protein